MYFNKRTQALLSAQAEYNTRILPATAELLRTETFALPPSGSRLERQQLARCPAMTGNGPRLQPGDQDRGSQPGRRSRQRPSAPGRRSRPTSSAPSRNAPGCTIRKPATASAMTSAFRADMQHRAYVHEVMRGFEEGSQARHELYERLREQDRPQPRQQAQTQPERELEAG